MAETRAVVENDILGLSIHHREVFSMEGRDHGQFLMVSDFVSSWWDRRKDVKKTFDGFIFKPFRYQEPGRE